MIFKPFKHCQQFILVPPSHYLSQRDFATRKELMNEKIISLSNTNYAQDKILDDFIQVGVNPNFVSSDSFASALLDIEFNHCIGTFAGYVLENIPNKFNLVYISIKDDYVTAYCVYNRDSNNPIVSEFIRFMDDYLQQHN